MSTDSWLSGVSGDWNTNADWTGGTPSAATTAAIAGLATYLVTLLATGAAHTLTLNDQGAEFYDEDGLTLGAGC